MKTLTAPALIAGSWFWLGNCFAMLIAGAGFGATASFEDLRLGGPESAEDGHGLNAYSTGTAFGEPENWNRFNSGGIPFENRTIPAFGSWSLWAYSNRTDAATAGFGNDLSAWTGGGADPATGATIPGGTYAIAFGESTWISLPASAPAPQSLMITNTTYAALAMRDGDGFSKRFGGTDGTDPDFFLLTILGETSGGTVTGSVDYYLADFRAEDSAADFIRSNWSRVDLTPLGTKVSTLRFQLSSSDNGEFGMNTPAYFALDNLVAVPEPDSMLLLLMGLLGCLGRRRESHRLRRRAVVVAAPLIFALTVLASALMGASAQAQGIPANDERIVDWATAVVSTIRGPIHAADHSLGYASFGDPLSALGPADVWAPLDQENAPVVSLGDGGQITLSFDPPIANGDGPDFAVFENGFSEDFLELAFVEVSKDGVTFRRFPATALRQADDQIGPFDAVKPSGLVNLAGMYPAGMGTPFDLAELGLQEATHVRIIDVVGSIDSAWGSPDSEGNMINDPFPTAYLTGGFDLDAVAVLHQRAITFAPDEDAVITFERWMSRHFDRKDPSLPDPEDFYADPDSDGLTNFEEYAFWTDPNAFSIPVSLTIRHLWDEDVVEVHLPPLPALRPDVDYSIESSGGLVYWQNRKGTAAVMPDLESTDEQFFQLVVRPLGDDVE